MPNVFRIIALSLVLSSLSGCAISWRGHVDPPPAGAGLPGQPLFDAVAVDGVKVQPSSSLPFATPARLFATLERSGLYAPGSGLGRTLDLSVQTSHSDTASIPSYLTATALPGFAWRTGIVAGFVSQDGRLLYEGAQYKADTTEMMWIVFILWPPSLFRALNDREYASWASDNTADACMRALESLLAELELHRDQIELATVDREPAK